MLQLALAPVSWVYAAAAAGRRRWTVPTRAAAPVICVGNLTLGGAGKTPVARAVRAVLGAGAHVLLRGYGGREKGPLNVAADADFRDVGDEALLHARDGPTWIARDRVAGAKAAIAAGARVIVMDDGFQNPTLVKDLALVVVDARAGVGNRKVFPAGPLRERLADGLARADAFVLMGEGEAPDWAAATGKPLLRAHLAPLAAPPAGPLIAFAGIARPEKFFDGLRGAGGEIAEAIPYTDHHPFDEGELRWLATLAAERGATLVATEKDCARLAPAWRGRITAFKVAAHFEDEAALAALLAKAVR
ncbi:MAG: tetraacyldisaccharide 4'-kinase [Alphaproteobacteria bacterium]|nr:tetraacyldisaccharide 4'-kinase [Alphaproteobacteria bacterium]